MVAKSKWKGYFEGWYFKIVDQAEKFPLAIIPGFSLPKNKKEHTAFIQILDAAAEKAYFINYSAGYFSSAKNKVDVQIGQSHFKLEALELDIEHAGINIKGSLQFSNIIPWPSFLFSPGAMGRFAFLPWMECYHGILSMNSKITGKLTVNGEVLDYNGGKGYVEKDWGSSMPSAWIWMQSNHFDDANVSFTLSIARVPYLNLTFNGFLIGLLVKGQFLRFTNYTGAKIRNIKTDKSTASIIVEDKNYRLEIAGRGTGGAMLVAPVLGEMKGRIRESLHATIELKLLDKKNKLIVYQGVGRNAGMEIVGKL